MVAAEWRMLAGLRSLQLCLLRAPYVYAWQAWTSVGSSSHSGYTRKAWSACEPRGVCTD